MSPEVLVSAERKKNLVGQPAIAAIKEIARRNRAIRAICISRILEQHHFYPIWLEREAILHEEAIEHTVEQVRKISSIGEKQAFVFFSRVRLDRLLPPRYGYIPMIDFSGQPYSYSQHRPLPWMPWILFRAGRHLRKIGQTEGIIARTDQSVHYIGINPMTERERAVFYKDVRCFPEIRVGSNGKPLLRPDEKWLDKTEKSRYQSLRFTDGLHRGVLKQEPVIIATL